MGNGIRDLSSYLPIVEVARSYRREDLPHDVVAGVAVGMLTVPQAVAYALLAGLPAQAGLYACLAPMVIHALLSSSRQLIVGPGGDRGTDGRFHRLAACRRLFRRLSGHHHGPKSPGRPDPDPPAAAAGGRNREPVESPRDIRIRERGGGGHHHQPTRPAHRHRHDVAAGRWGRGPARPPCPIRVGGQSHRGRARRGESAPDGGRAPVGPCPGALRR